MAGSSLAQPIAWATEQCGGKNEVRRVAGFVLDRQDSWGCNGPGWDPPAGARRMTLASRPAQVRNAGELTLSRGWVVWYDPAAGFAGEEMMSMVCRTVEGVLHPDGQVTPSP